MSFLAKTFEVRDVGTFIPCVGVLIDLAATSPSTRRNPDLTPADFYLARRAGYAIDTPLVLFGRLDGDSRMFPYDPINWGDRTMRAAHQYVQDNWDDLPSGAVICVETICGERDIPKLSEVFGL